MFLCKANTTHENEVREPTRVLLVRAIFHDPPTPERFCVSTWRKIQNMAKEQEKGKNRTVLIAVDGSEHSNRAFDCEYKTFL